MRSKTKTISRRCKCGSRRVSPYWTDTKAGRRVRIRCTDCHLHRGWRSVTGEFADLADQNEPEISKHSTPSLFADGIDQHNPERMERPG